MHSRTRAECASVTAPLRRFCTKYQRLGGSATFTTNGHTWNQLRDLWIADSLERWEKKNFQLSIEKKSWKVRFTGWRIEDLGDRVQLIIIWREDARDGSLGYFCFPKRAVELSEWRVEFRMGRRCRQYHLKRMEEKGDYRQYSQTKVLVLQGKRANVYDDDSWNIVMTRRILVDHTVHEICVPDSCSSMSACTERG